MSRLGKIPVDVPKEVKVSLDKGSVRLEGPKGNIALSIPGGISLENKEGKIYVNRANNSKQSKTNHGTTRAHLKNMVIGVTQGHKRNLQIQGVGFRVQQKGQELEFSLGFSHPIKYHVPAEVKVKAGKPTEIELESVDKAMVGEVAAKIRNFKPPEPYKGKGIRYEGEVVRRKQGKSVTK